MKVILVNPNTNARTTELMVGRAHESVITEVYSESVEIIGATVQEGQDLIIDEQSLAKSGQSVVSLIKGIDISNFNGVIIAAFGDPGLYSLSLHVPVVGIGESSIRRAIELGEQFSIVTTTPALRKSIERQVSMLDANQLFLGVVLTVGDPCELMMTEKGLEDALAASCETAIAQGAKTIIIGGGPLGSAAPALQTRFQNIVVLEPVQCAVKAILKACRPRI